jgi:hypothetical protein
MLMLVVARATSKTLMFRSWSEGHTVPNSGKQSPATIPRITNAAKSQMSEVSRQPLTAQPVGRECFGVSSLMRATVM